MRRKRRAATQTPDSLGLLREVLEHGIETARGRRPADFSCSYAPEDQLDLDPVAIQHGTVGFGESARI